MAFGIVMDITYPFINYMNFGMWVMWSMGTFLMIPLVVITLAKANELFRVSIGIPPERLACSFHLKPWKNSGTFTA